MRTKAKIVAAWLVLAVGAVAQIQQPGPEHKKLDVFAGAWTLDGDIKPGPVGPGGKVNESQKCEWMDGSFFLVCHADFKSDMGSVSGVSFMGYSGDAKSYTYREFNSMGEFMEMKGSVDGDTWTWTGDDKMNGTLTKGRFTMKLTSPTSYTFTYEMSQDGTKWTTVMDGKASKAK